MTSGAAGKKLPPRLDPVFPLPADSGIPVLKQGEGRMQLRETTPTRVVELPHRAFWMLWEIIESKALRDYPKYVDGPMDNAAQAYLEAVHAFRSAFAGRPLPVMSEERAQKARMILAKHDVEESKKSKQKKTAPEPTEAPESPPKRDRCSSTHRTPKMALVRCGGPVGHKRKHKGKSKYGEIVEWEDE